MNGGLLMAIRKSQQRAVQKYNAAHYDRLEAKVPAGEKEAIQQHATNRGESLNQFLCRAIRETMERDGEPE